jgi:hypothetical protein
MGDFYNTPPLTKGAMGDFYNTPPLTKGAMGILLQLHMVNKYNLKFLEISPTPNPSPAASSGRGGNYKNILLPKEGWGG